MTKQTRDMAALWAIMVILLACAGWAGWLIGNDNACAPLDQVLAEANARMDVWAQCSVSYVSPLPGSPEQNIQLTCPDSVRIEVGK
jgi:hypothetical protein